MTAALYSLRAGKSVLLIEREGIGGQIANSPRVENYPTIKSISGMDLANEMYEQIEAMGAELEMDEVMNIEKEGDLFKVQGTYGSYEAKAVILATGVKHRRLGIPGEDKYEGKGISYCAVCDGDFYAGQNTMVIGDANSALQYAILLSGKAKHVDVVTLFDRFFAEDALVKALEKLPNVAIYHNLNSIEFLGDDSKLEKVHFQNTQTKEDVILPTDGCFVAIGQIPDNERYANLVELNKGYIVADESMATKTPGLFVAGDCREKKIRQVATAVGDGAIAALSAVNYLATLN